MIDYALAYTPFVNKTRDFLVKCTRDELWKLVDGNDSYGFIFYASDAEGRFVYTNADALPRAAICITVSRLSRS